MNYKENTVTVSVGEKEFSKTYQQIDKSTLTVADMLAKLQGDEKEVKQFISDWHYGQDLRAKADVRAKIVAEIAGPEKSFEKMVKDFMKLRETMGKAVSEEQARKIVKMMQDAEGLE